MSTVRIAPASMLSISTPAWGTSVAASRLLEASNMMLKSFRSFLSSLLRNQTRYRGPFFCSGCPASTNRTASNWRSRSSVATLGTSTQVPLTTIGRLTQAG